MKFSEMITKLYEISRPYSLFNVNIISDCQFTDVNMLPPNLEVLSPNSLYFADASYIKKNTPIPNCLFYYGEFPNERKGELVNSVQIDNKDMAALFQHIKDMLLSESPSNTIYPDILHMFLSGTKLDSILSKMCDLSGNLYAIIDSTGKIIAKTENFYVNYNVWMKSIEQGYCVESLMDYIDENRKKNNYSMSTAPFVLFCKHLSMYIMCNRIVFENVLMGYVFTISKKNVFSPMEQQLIPLLANAVRDLIFKQSERGWRNYKAVQVNNVFQDMIAGPYSHDLERRIKFAKISFPPIMRVCILSPIYYRESSFFKSSLIPAFINIFGECPMTVYKDELISLVSVDEHGNIEKRKLDELRSFAQENKIRIGISNSFSQTRELSNNYDQARQVLRFAKQISTDEKMFFFSDYICYALFDQVSDNSLFSYAMHPALDILSKNDEEKNTCLYQTLKVYTSTGFNKNKTSELMFLHRNTINYRIQQIETLCNLDFSDISLLFPLQLSFIIDCYINNLPVGR